MGAVAALGSAIIDVGNEIKAALIGCGGRGSGAADNAMKVNGPFRLVAMADVRKERLDASHEAP